MSSSQTTPSDHPSMTFDDQVAFFTGAEEGLGLCHALEPARRCARVVLNDLGSAVDGGGAVTRKLAALANT